jgi:hypothetical protein
MRRFGSLVTLGFCSLAACVSVAWWEPAGAHICPFTSKIPVGTPVTTRVYVAVEGIAIPKVEMELPEALALQQVEAAPSGWTYSRRGQTLQFQGPPASPYTCLPFDLTVVAEAKGVFPVGIIQRDARAKVVSRSTTGPEQGSAHPGFSPLVYAGVTPPSPPGAGVSVTLVAGIVLLSAGALLALIQVAKARRARTARGREKELESRLDMFKKQMRDRD